MKALVACFVVALSVLAGLAHLVVTDPKPLHLTVRPLISFAPTNVEIKVRVHADTEDRWISVQADSGEFARRSDWTIEGDRVLYVVSWRDLPAGEYDITASIGHGDQIRAQDRAHIVVNGFWP